jgi:RNA polymerase sigma-70 factor (ECF subfamily)
VSMAPHAELLRRLYPRGLAKLLASTRALPDAEDAVHDAIERALRAWPVTGAPRSPEAWLVTVAANAHRDRLRRARRREPHRYAIEQLALMSPWARIALGEPDVARGWKDELLRLLFACCHPALDEGESAALALATVVGLSTQEIAAAFVVAPRSMEQRLTRARQRLRTRGDYEGSSPEDGRERIGAVLRTIHLLFNEGYWSTASDAPIRADLCRLAIGLARSLLETYPEEPEVAGLSSLLLLHDARRGARLDARGEPVPLPEQDRARWDHETIRSATALLERALEAGAPGPFQVEAAIAAVHCRAAAVSETDWGEIAALYAVLEALRPTPAVRVNRAFAVARASGPAQGLALLDRRDPIDTGSHPYVHLVRGALLEELGQHDAAKRALERAEVHARNAHERAQIRRRIERLDTDGEGRPPSDTGRTEGP